MYCVAMQKMWAKNDAQIVVELEEDGWVKHQRETENVQTHGRTNGLSWHIISWHIICMMCCFLHKGWTWSGGSWQASFLLFILLQLRTTLFVLWPRRRYWKRRWKCRFETRSSGQSFVPGIWKAIGSWASVVDPTVSVFLFFSFSCYLSCCPT